MPCSKKFLQNFFKEKNLREHLLWKQLKENGKFSAFRAVKIRPSLVEAKSVVKSSTTFENAN